MECPFVQKKLYYDLQTNTTKSDTWISMMMNQRVRLIQRFSATNNASQLNG